MAKEKLSFFQRLTGAIRVEEDEKDEKEEEDEEEKDASWIEEDADEGQLAVDVYQTPSDIIIRTMAAGVRPEDLDISISRDMVSIKGKRETDKSVSEDNFFHRELYWGSFSRTILLPQEIEPEEAEASEKNGLITIKLPKIDKGRQMKVKVKSS